MNVVTMFSNNSTKIARCRDGFSCYWFFVKMSRNKVIQLEIDHLSRCLLLILPSFFICVCVCVFACKCIWWKVGHSVSKKGIKVIQSFWPGIIQLLMNLLSYPKMSEKNTNMNDIHKHTNTQKQKALNENLKINSDLRF